MNITVAKLKSSDFTFCRLTGIVVPGSLEGLCKPIISLNYHENVSTCKIIRAMVTEMVILCSAAPHMPQVIISFFLYKYKKLPTKSTMHGAAEHVSFTYMFACVNVCPYILSPATRMRSVVRIRCVCGASVQSMSPVELREPSVRVRATAGLTSAVPFNQVSLKTSTRKTDLLQPPAPCTQHS